MTPPNPDTPTKGSELNHRPAGYESVALRSERVTPSGTLAERKIATRRGTARRAPTKYIPRRQAPLTLPSPSGGEGNNGRPRGADPTGEPSNLGGRFANRPYEETA